MQSRFAICSVPCAATTGIYTYVYKSWRFFHLKMASLASPQEPGKNIFLDRRDMIDVHIGGLGAHINEALGGCQQHFRRDVM